MKKHLLRSLSFLFCLSSNLLSCEGSNTPSTNNPSVESSINIFLCFLKMYLI